ncbi:AimR family lysis-lysogeny pheromone receptor [Peribacillus sp. NPDC096379]|uniref:AimR family lysis-lysogeny pheromone receptor n=1 Tax=Peribacillus sp. NPDC096379 TaxID=3364393 RepID=UPI0037F5F5DA
MKYFDFKLYIRNLQLNDETILSKLAGYASTSGFIKWLDDPKRDIQDFDRLIKIVKYLFPDRETEIMERYAMTLESNEKTARQILEYLSCNRRMEAFRQLLDRMLGTINKESLEWAKVHNLQHEWLINSYTLDKNQFLNDVSHLKVKDEYLNVFVKIMKCYIYHYKRIIKWHVR